MNRILVVDDEPLARARIVNLLAADHHRSEVREAANGTDAVSIIDTWHPDVIFLDIQMPGLDGFGVVERVGPERMPITIFVTAFDEHAIRAFEAQALDYILKPFEPARLHQALERARRQLGLERREEVERKLTALLASVSERKYPQRFAVRTGPKITFVPAESVDWISAEGNYVGLHAGREVHLLRGTLSEMESRLDPEAFLRIHRSRIVNLRSVRSIESVFKGEYVIVLKDGTKLNSSGGYRERLETALLRS